MSPLPALACMLVAMATAFFLVKQFGSPPGLGRYASIDGLRGYLAFFVFLHHSCIWYFFLRTGQWQAPPSNLYNHFGQGSVALFFMITGFLFFSKLIDGRTRSIDWGKLFISRLLRLVPLYLFVMLLLFIAVAILSRGEVYEAVPGLLKSAASWLAFTIPGAPDLNGIEHTFIIVAGVTWSLPYEWLFYCALPILALAVRVTPPLAYIVFSVASVAALVMLSPRIHPLILVAFLGGMAASLLVRIEGFRRFATGRIATVILLGCIATAVKVYPSAFGYAPLLLLSAAFVLIACGNSLFGILVSPVSRTLGEMAYSIYLLHGITLFTAFTLLLNATDIHRASPLTHWLLITALTPVLLCASYATFRWIESPAMHSTTAVTAWLRSRLTRRGRETGQ
ncbi:MAG: acyltransferase [Nitrosomonadales bacterium]|nr:acyltransferase [Nitrosomonadales bacterium]